MAKTIKFNLILDGNPVRDLEGLKENFNIDDLLKYYENGLLQKWLSVRGYKEILKEIETISSQDKKEIARKLVQIFAIEIESNRLEEALYGVDFHGQHRSELLDFQMMNFQHEAVIKGYFNGYTSLLKAILEDKDNIARMRNSLRQISENYVDIFKYHLPSLYQEFLEKAPLAIYVTLMTPKLRIPFLENHLIVNNLKKLVSQVVYGAPNEFFSQEYEKKLLPYNLLKTHSGYASTEWQQIEPLNQRCIITGCSNISAVKILGAKEKENTSEITEESSQFIGKVFDGFKVLLNNRCDINYIPLNSLNSLPNPQKQEMIMRKLFYLAGKHLKTFKGDTQSYWKDIETKDKRFMIIGMREGNFVRGAGRNGEELSAKDVNGKFPILDGIDYKSNNPDHEIGYLEF